MTWIIGGTTIFGYGYIFSDTCVTITDENGATRTMDVLQKAYPIAPDIVAGFAGSILIGFRMLHHLRQQLQPPDGREDWAWDLGSIIENMPPLFQEIFQKSSPQEQASGAAILMVSAHPTENSGIEMFPKAQMAIFRSPNFQAEFYDGGHVIKSIGSGSQIYEDSLVGFSKSMSPYASLERGMRGAMAQSMAFALAKDVQKKRASGVSDHMHCFTIHRGEFAHGTNDYEEVLPDGTRNNFKMPEVATSWEDLLKKIDGGGSAILVA